LPWRLQVLQVGAGDAALRAAIAGLVTALGRTHVVQRHVSDSFPDLPAAVRTWPDGERWAAEAFSQYDGSCLYPETVAGKEWTEVAGAGAAQAVSHALAGLLRRTRALGLSD